MTIQWDTSWDPPSRKKTVEGSLERIETMLTRAYLSVKAVQRDDNALNIYVSNFDDNPLANLAAVTNVIKLMYERVTDSSQNLILSYVPDDATFNSLGVGSLPVGIRIVDVEAFVVQRGIDSSTSLRMFICPSFFTGDVYIPNSINQRTGTGTILHELSHGVGNTVDHAYTWSPDYNTITAVQRASNADSYRAYCQYFDNPSRI